MYRITHADMHLFKYTDCISKEQFLTLLNNHKENLTEEIKEDLNERIDEVINHAQGIIL